MNINPLIETAFKDFTVEGKSIPISFLRYTGQSDTYLTYYTWLCQPNNFYNDEHHVEVAYGTIDIFSKGNFKKLLKQVKKILKDNNFTWTDDGPEDFESETGYYHVPINFYFEGTVENI